jgi:DNA polymerase-3 subunit epsilon
MLSEELSRCGLNWPLPGAKYLDAFHVFREKEKRDLGSAVQFYCGRVHEDAHDALADVRASWHVIKGQMMRYPDIATLETFGTFCDNPRALDLAARLVLNDDGIACYAFGKHEGKPVKSEKAYAQWMISSNTFPTNTVRVLKAIIYG